MSALVRAWSSFSNASTTRTSPPGCDRHRERRSPGRPRRPPRSAGRPVPGRRRRPGSSPAPAGVVAVVDRGRQRLAGRRDHLVARGAELVVAERRRRPAAGSARCRWSGPGASSASRATYCSSGVRSGADLGEQGRRRRPRRRPRRPGGRSRASSRRSPTSSKSASSGSWTMSTAPVGRLAEQLPVDGGGGEAEAALQHRRRLHQRGGRGQVGVEARRRGSPRAAAADESPSRSAPSSAGPPPSRSTRAARRRRARTPPPARGRCVRRSCHQRTPTTRRRRAGPGPATAATTTGHAFGHGGSPLPARSGVRLAPWPRTDVLAAGAVVFRPGKRVLLVHRPRVRRLVLPQGQARPGRARHRRPPSARSRRRPGCTSGSGVPLTDQRYPVTGGRMKPVSYWVGPGRSATTT